MYLLYKDKGDFPAIVSLLEGMTYQLPSRGPQHLGPHKSPWFGGDTVDASEIQRSPVDMFFYPPLFTLFFIYARWLFGISEASTVNSMFHPLARIDF